MGNINLIKNELFKFDISISGKCYDHKPTSNEYAQMIFHVENLNVEELIHKITSGYSICHVFKNQLRKKDNFIYTNVVFVDVDESDICMVDFIDMCMLKPTLAYTTASNGEPGKGFRFRLLYVFNAKIATETLYKSLYYFIVNRNNLQGTKDNCGSVCNQLMNGNSNSNVETYCSYLIYILDKEFVSKCSLEYTTTPPPHYISKEHFETECSETLNGVNVHEYDSEVTRMINLLMQDVKAFLAFYEGHIEVINESIIDFNEEGYAFYPDDYYCLFFRYDWKNKKVNKFKDHEKRRRRIYIDACIMRCIKPDATFQDLLYNLVLRRQRYYDNSDGVLTNNFLIQKVCQVLSMDYSVLQSINPSKHGLYRVDKTYCYMNGITPKSYSRVVAGKIHQKEIAKWYNPEKSLKDNLNDAKNKGIKVSRKTLSKYCKDNGLNIDPMRIPPEQWYDKSLSVEENLQLALDSGLKTSRPVLYRFCKEHGINPGGER